MARARARSPRILDEFGFAPLVRLTTVHGSVIAAFPINKSSKNDHLARIVVEYCSVFVSRSDFDTFALDERPSESLHTELVYRCEFKLVTVSNVTCTWLIFKDLTCVIIATEKQHVVSVDYTCVVGDGTRLLRLGTIY